MTKKLVTNRWLRQGKLPTWELILNSMGWMKTSLISTTMLQMELLAFTSQENKRDWESSTSATWVSARCLDTIRKKTLSIMMWKCSCQESILSTISSSYRYLAKSLLIRSHLEKDKCLENISQDTHFLSGCKSRIFQVYLVGGNM